MQTVRWLAGAALLAGMQAPALAQSMDPAMATGLKKELIGQLQDAESKLIGLANTMTQAQYAWRPAGDANVRSGSEVFVHVAQANVMIASIAGVAAPSDFSLPANAEKAVTSKAQVVDALTKSFAHVKRAVMMVPDAQMDASVNLFGSPSTKRGVLVLLATHAHEHLGQMISYARSQGVKPPWAN